MSPQQAASLPIIGGLYHPDVWWVALVNELLGVIVLGGMLLVIYRRYVQKDPQLRTLPADSMVILLLTLVAFSGFPTETFRLLADYATATGAFAPNPAMLPPDKFPLALYDLWGPPWAFAGYLSALALGMLGVIPVVYVIGMVAIKINSAPYPHTQAAWGGITFMMVYLAVCVIIFIVGVWTTLSRKKNEDELVQA